MRLNSGKILRGLMDSKQVSNEDVARAAGVGRTFISALVNERRTSCKPETATEIARYLQVPLDIIFTPKTSTDSGSSDAHELRRSA
jgi:transcriptional regulator with XRE-family HTH domain